MHRLPGTRLSIKHMHCLDQPSHLLTIMGLVIEAVLFGLFTSCMMVDQWDVLAMFWGGHGGNACRNAG